MAPYPNASNEVDPYGLITEFWGEDLSTELTDRILSAPESHLDRFQEFLFDHPSGMGQLPELSPGHLRPALMSCVEDLARRRRNALDVVQLAPGVLLYAHEIVLDDVALYLTSTDPNERRRAADWLMSVRPLFDQGSLFFRPLSSSKRHPAYRAVFGPAVGVERSDLLDLESVRTEVAKISAILEREGVNPVDARSIVEDTLINDGTIHVRHQATWANRSHRLFRTRAEMDIFRSYLGTLYEPAARDFNLTDLVSLSVPVFSAREMNSLVQVRSSSEAFNNWRSHLAASLDRIPSIDPLDDDSLTMTRLRLREELLPITEGIERETRRSAALTAIREGTKNFGVAMLAGFAGFVAGGNIGAAVASASVGKVAETAVGYHKARAMQRQKAQLADLAVTFTEPT